MSPFIETIRKDSGFELCGRILREGEDLLVFIDGVGRFVIPTGVVLATLLGLGDSEISGPVPGIARLSRSGKGFYLDINGVSYVTPVSRVRAVIDGKNRKGPLSVIR